MGQGDPGGQHQAGMTRTRWHAAPPPVGGKREIQVACLPRARDVKKIIGGVTAIVSYRPGGWMQQSTVPRCAILSVGSTEGIGQ
jgi:hypothetical protein